MDITTCPPFPREETLPKKKKKNLALQDTKDTHIDPLGTCSTVFRLTARSQ